MAAATVSPDRSEIYLRFAVKIGVISETDFAREAAAFRNQDATAIGKALVEKGVLHPNNFKLLESMFARQMSRMTQPVPVPENATAPSSQEPAAQKVERRQTPRDFQPEVGVDVARGDTTKLKGSPLATTRYKLVRPLATSLHSELFIAEDVELHREVVFKRLQAKYQKSPATRIRFNCTAEVTSGLEHPCIPPIYNHGLDADGRPYYTTRYLTGETLRESVARLLAADSADPPRSLETFSRAEELRKHVERLLQVCQALAFAHARGVVHCGLSPERILLGKYGETLVVGWGRAELLYGRKTKPAADAKGKPANGETAAPGADASSKSREATPTPFVSPEQFIDPASAGILADVYSLGAVLYFALTGTAPFGDAVDELPAQIDAGLQGSTLAAARAVSGDLARIVAKAMAKDPLQRQASVREFAAELEAWLNGSSSPKANASAPSDAKQSPRRQTIAKRSWRTPMLLAAGCALCAAGGYFLGGRTTPSLATQADPSENDSRWNAGDLQPWFDLASNAALAAPQLAESWKSAVERFSATHTIEPFHRRQAAYIDALLSRAELALSRNDFAKTSASLNEVRPLLLGYSISGGKSEALRPRWASAVVNLSERLERTDSFRLLESAVADAERHPAAAEDQAWLRAKRTMANGLARHHARQGRFAEAVRLVEAPISEATDESTLRTSVDRGEWLLLAGRDAEAAKQFTQLAGRLKSGGESMNGDARRRLERRLAAGLAESTNANLERARKLSAELNAGDAESRSLRARLDGAEGRRLIQAGKYKEAEPLLVSATKDWTGLISGEGGAAELRWAAAAWDALRQVYGDSKRTNEALDAAEKAGALLERIAFKDSVRSRVEALDMQRGTLLVQLGRLKDAEAAFTRVVERGGAASGDARYLRSACRLERKEWAAARRDAEELGKVEGASRYLAARVFAQLSLAKSERDAAAAPADGARAVQLLKELAGKNFFIGERASLPTGDPELEPLRRRADFKETFSTPPAATATANPMGLTP